MPIDPALLPARALFDTGVLIRALRQRNDAHSLQCQQLFDAMLEAGHDIIVATPTLAEIYRGLPQDPVKPKPPPKFPGLEIVSFDERAAIIVGTLLPQSVLKETKSKTGTPLSYLKADAMIVACGVVGKASCIVSLDADHHELATAAGIPMKRPADFEKKQGELKLIATPPTAK